MTSLANLPSSICIRLTRRCNASCGFCQAPDTDRSTLKADEFEPLLQWLATRHVRSIKLSGGEPTVRRDLSEFIDTGTNHALKITVITNGIYLTDKVTAALQRNSGELKFSIHYPNKTNDLVLQRPCFDTIKSNLTKARGAGIPCSINTVVHRENGCELADMVHFAWQHDCRKISFIPFVPRGRGLAHQDVYSQTSTQIDTVMTEIRRLAIEFAGHMDIRCIDLRSKPYWIVENDLSLISESWTEAEDKIILRPAEMREAIGIYPGMTAAPVTVSTRTMP